MSQEFIEIVNGFENNLKNIHLKIPKGKITIFTGVSGSGKSSIVFDTIAQEAGRQLNETYNSFVRNFLPKYKRPKADEIINLSAAIVIDQKQLGGNARSTLGTITDINALFRLLFSRFASPSLGYMNAYSFNDPTGMCPKCEGIGKVIMLDVSAAINMELSLNEGAILLPGFTSGSYYWKLYANSGYFDMDKKIKDYSKEELDKLLYSEAEKVPVESMGMEHNGTYEGLAVRFMRTNVQVDKELTKSGAKVLEKFSTTCQCPECLGKRYHQQVLESKINDYSIFDVTNLQLDQLLSVLNSFDSPSMQPIIDNIKNRVSSLCEIGLGYLTLTRETSTLSGGESQRVKMVKHLSSSLNGMLYIFDEPSTGLHPRDVHRLNNMLRQIRDKGNTVLVVEHDPDVIKAADYIVDVGPKAGERGGNITFTGSYQELLLSDTITGQFLSMKEELKNTPRTSLEFIESSKSSLHNLKNVSLNIPKGIFTVVTGVAGSGKSTLVHQVFAKDIPDVVCIDQSSVHTSKRSNSATYIGIMDPIRKAFANVNQVEPGLFSSNSTGGCEACKGTGVIELNMSFMEKVETVCSQCNGTRYKSQVLQYLYKEKSIVDIMEMTVSEALDFFEEKDIHRHLKSLKTVGLGYLRLGQSLNTLSGGECQRLKLAKELNAKGKIYILDEPTTGLHLSDIENILNIIDRLVSKGNTVIVIEHNLSVIRNADWIVDLGPDGGSDGGEILFEGTPLDLTQCANSITARYI